MLLVSISIILLTIIQTVICHFSFPIFITIVARLIFLSRTVGIVIPIKVSFGIEIAGVSLLLIWCILFKHAYWLIIATYIITGAIVVLIEYADSLLYLYVVEDDNTDE